MSVTKIEWNNEEWVLVHGAIAKEDVYKMGFQSYAHLFDDGTIKRFGKPIGKREDIIIIDENYEVEEDDSFLANCLNPFWGWQ